MEKELKRISVYEGSTLLGMNGGQPESPDGQLLVYARKPSLTEALTEIWICDRNTLENGRKVFTVSCGNHNGPSATFVDNKHIVFRDTIDQLSAFRILNIDTGEVLYGPVFAKESHCAENGWYPFSVSEEFLGKNPEYPQIDRSGIYLLNLVAEGFNWTWLMEVVCSLGTQPCCTTILYTVSLSATRFTSPAARFNK